MSVTDVDCTASEHALCAFPEFDLCGLVDDADDPTEVTVSPVGADAERLATTWLTVDADAVVPLTEVR